MQPTSVRSSRRRRERPGSLLARRTRTVKRDGTVPVPVPCSRIPERARSECARSTAAAEPTRVPFHERRNELAWKDHWCAQLREALATPQREVEREGLVGRLHLGSTF